VELFEEQDRLSDELDRAASVAQVFNDERVSEARLKVKPKQIKHEDGTWPQPDCVSCGEPIDPRRLEAVGAIRCTECESRAERY
jgi:RNA polymerase-binding transcription factor DksA